MKRLLFAAYTMFVLLAGASFAVFWGGNSARAHADFARVQAHGVVARIAVADAKTLQVIVDAPKNSIKRVSNTAKTVHIHLE